MSGLEFLCIYMKRFNFKLRNGLSSSLTIFQFLRNNTKLPKMLIKTIGLHMKKLTNFSKETITPVGI